MKSYILTNYTVQCADVTTGKTGCFLFNVEHWQKTGEFKAISNVYNNLVEFYANTNRDDRKSLYLER
jgi:hypothetical protein